MSELYVYSDDDDYGSQEDKPKDFITNVTVSSIKNKYSSLGLITFYINEPTQLEIDSKKANLSCESYLYKLFQKACNESKLKKDSLN